MTVDPCTSLILPLQKSFTAEIIWITEEGSQTACVNESWRFTEQSKKEDEEPSSVLDLAFAVSHRIFEFINREMITGDPACKHALHSDSTLN